MMILEIFDKILNELQKKKKKKENSYAFIQTYAFSSFLADFK